MNYLWSIVVTCTAKKYFILLHLFVVDSNSSKRLDKKDAEYAEKIDKSIISKVDLAFI